MSQQVTETLAGMRNLGSVGELRALAQGTVVSAGYVPGNSHIHLPPNFSAFETVGQAVKLAKAQGLGVLGASNYYDYTVYGEFGTQARQAGIFPLFGLEIICLLPELKEQGIKINDPGNPGKLYLCGKGITKFAPFTAQGQILLDEIRRNDSTRMRAMIEALVQVCAERGIATGLNEGAVIDWVVKRHGCPRETVYLQERHVAQAFQEAIFNKTAAGGGGDRAEKLAGLFGAASKVAGKWDAKDAVTVQNEIRSHLMKAGKAGYVAETFIGLEKARQLILELGGVPCYPTLADGNVPLCQFEEPVEQLITRIKEMGVFAAELVPGRNSPEVLAKYVKAFRAAGLVVTAGTEHNSLDLIPLEPSCKGEVEIAVELKQIFWEGACVVAAHQYLNLHHEIGYVDGQGKLNPAYGSDDERIKELAKLGAAVIARYTNN